MKENSDKNSKLRDENQDMATRLQDLIKQYEAREAVSATPNFAVAGMFHYHRKTFWIIGIKMVIFITPEICITSLCMLMPFSTVYFSLLAYWLSWAMVSLNGI